MSQCIFSSMGTLCKISHQKKSDLCFFQHVHTKAQFLLLIQTPEMTFKSNACVRWIKQATTGRQN